MRQIPNKIILILSVFLLILATGLYFFYLENVIRSTFDGHTTILSRFMSGVHQNTLSYYITTGRSCFYLGLIMYIHLAILLMLCNQNGGFSKSLDVKPTSTNALIVLFSNLILGIFYFINFGYEGNWYIIENIISLKGNPPYQHRIFFVIIANAAKSIVPQLSVLWAFYISQAIALLAALLAVRLLAGHLFDRGSSYLAYYFMIMMWMPTVTYYTFYDIGIIAFYALALYFLYSNNVLLFLAVFLAGTLNHEITLFLMGVSSIKLFMERKFKLLIKVSVAGLSFYALLRAVLFALIPADRAWSSGKFLQNVQRVSDDPMSIVYNMLPLFIVYGISFFAVKRSDSNVKASIVLLPLLLIMTLLVGQLNEARLFNSFIPVVICLLLGFVAVPSSFKNNAK